MKVEDYIVDCIINYLQADDVDEREPHVTTFELDGIQVVCFTINHHPLCYDVDEILWYGLETIRERDNWRQY